MTERWQRELKKLGSVDAPVSRMRAQIAAGPSDGPPQPEPGRSPAQRITAGVVAFAVFAAAAVFAYRALRPGGVAPGVAGSQTVTIDLSRSSDASRAIGDVASLSAQFSATLTAGGSSIQEAPSSVCVSGSQCLAPAPRPLDLTLTSGSPVHLSAYNVQGRVELSQTNGDSTDTLLLTNDSTLPGPGHYLLQLEASSAGVSAFWNYAVEVVASGTVQTPEPTPSPPAGSEPQTPTPQPVVTRVLLNFNTTTSGTPDCPGSPEATITYGDQTTKGAPTSFTWTCPGSSMVADTIMPSFSDSQFVQVPVGTLLTVGGDLSAAEGNLQRSSGSYPWTTLQSLGDLGGGVDLSFDPGRYVIEATAHWPNGAIRFYFPIELVASTSPTPPPPGMPDVLNINCDSGPSITDPTVAVQADGLHIRMVGAAPSNKQIAFYGRDDYFLATTGVETFATGAYTGEFTRSAATGVYDVKCFPKGADPATINAATTVRVVDPNHVWVSTGRGCPVADRGALSVTNGSHPTEEAAVRALDGVVAPDTVEPAGYTQDLVDRQRYTDYNAWRVVRDGVVVAWTWVAGSQGSWQAVHGVGCISAGTGHPPTGPSPSSINVPSP